MIRVVATAVFALSLAACASDSAEERCDTMLTYLEERERDLSRECTVDIDCSVVFVRPGVPLAVNAQQPTDPALARVLREYQAQCAPLPSGEGSLQAICLERIVDTPTGEQETLSPACTLRGTFEAEDVGVDAGEIADAGSDATADSADDVDASCACVEDAECADGVCLACACVQAGLCASACGQAWACDAQGALGLGLTPEACVDGCEAALESDPGFESFATCLRDASCAAISGCAGELP